MKRRTSGADEAGVQGAGEGDVGGALNDGAAVGEEGKGVGGTLEAEEEVVETDVAVRAEAVAHGGEVHGTMVLMDLDGVAAAEGDVGAALACEVGELPVGADRAVGVGGGGVDLATVVGPEVEGEEGAAHEVGLVG